MGPADTRPALMRRHAGSAQPQCCHQSNTAAPLGKGEMVSMTSSSCTLHRAHSVESSRLSHAPLPTADGMTTP
eukprot:4541012-Amphidinium_carterae.1